MSGSDFSKEEMAVISEFYPSEGGDVFRRLPGRTRKSCQNKATHMGVKYAPGNFPIAMQFIEAAKGPRGFANADFVNSGMNYKTVQTRASQLVAEGRLFTTPAKGSQIKRYFDTQERCDAFYKDYIPPNAKRRPKPGKFQCIPGTLATRPQAGGPARIEGEPYFPTNPDGTPAYKITIAPPPPARIWKSNTFSGAY